MTDINRIVQGDSLEVLKTFESESIDCVVTSPPYYALRDYGVDGQIGLENTFQEYINKLLDLFDEVKRVLKKDGTCWVNLGDSYSGNIKGSGGHSEKQESFKGTHFKPIKIKTEIQDKSLLQIPSRFAIGMTDRGWILRNELIWYKPNCMPASVKDRFTVDFEKLFFFVKSKKYYFEQQQEDATYTDSRHGKGNIRYKARLTNVGVTITDFRNKRAVWKITTRPYKEAHFATYPEALIETPIKAGCPEFICDKCGKPREKMYENNVIGETSPIGGVKHKENGNRQYSGNTELRQKDFIGYTDCGCNSTYHAGIVLDPFFGSGTTGVVALKQNKNFIGIELNPEYIKIAEKRLKPFREQTKLAI